MYDASLFIIYNVDADHQNLLGEICAIDIPASKFATLIKGEYISNKKITSPRGVKIHVTGIPDSLDINKTLHPEYSDTNGKVQLVRRRAMTLVTTRMDQNLIQKIAGNGKEGTIPWVRFKTFIMNHSKGRNISNSDIEVKVEDFRSNPLTAAIRGTR